MIQEKDFFGHGWSFPMKPGANGRLALITGEEKIRQSIWAILSTAPGERQMRPDFGCGIHDLVFQPNTDGMRNVIQGRVREALIRWEPRINVIDVRVETPDGMNNYLMIRIDYRLRTNNAFYNLVYPFFINEGAG